MTYIDKLRADHPDWNEFKIGYTVGGSCPSDFGFPDIRGCSDNDECLMCWQQEFPEEEKTEDHCNNLKVAYLCDRKACPNCSYPLCSHTTDIDHAVNFQKFQAYNGATEDRYMECEV